VGIDEGGRDQTAGEVDDLSYAVGETSCRFLGPDPGDLVIGDEHGGRERVGRAVDEPAAIQRGGG
jgi:hypothetical protein